MLIAFGTLALESMSCNVHISLCFNNKNSMLKRLAMKLSHIMSKYFWEAYCLFEILHDENLYLDIISNIDGLASFSIFIFFKLECLSKDYFF